MKSSERPHPLELEQWLLDEQTPAQRARTEARLDVDQREQLRADDAALRERLFAAQPPARFVARLQRSHSRRRLYVASLVAAAAALFLLVRTPEAPSERVKGQTMELRVYRQRDGGVERLHEGARVAPRELLQLGFVREGHSHGVLLSLDGRGAVTLHAPPGEQQSSELPQESGEQLLGHAYELDDAPSFERFVFVAADQPLDVKAVLAAARALAADPQRARTAPLALATPNHQRSLLVVKP
ncbi:MAG: ActD-like protein [Polyangiales bacterium]